MWCKWPPVTGSLQMVVDSLQPGNGFLQPAACRLRRGGSCWFQNRGGENKDQVFVLTVPGKKNYTEKRLNSFESASFVFSTKMVDIGFVDYIIPPIPPPIPPGGIIGCLSSFSSTRTHSVVRNIPAIDAAFSKATRVTLAGSITPDSKRF